MTFLLSILYQNDSEHLFDKKKRVVFITSFRHYVLSSLRPFVLSSYCNHAKSVLYSGQTIYPIWKQYRIAETLETYSNLVILKCSPGTGNLHAPIVPYDKKLFLTERE
jgi:hypothetical protein